MNRQGAQDVQGQDLSPIHDVIQPDFRNGPASRGPLNRSSRASSPRPLLHFMEEREWQSNRAASFSAPLPNRV